MAVSPPHKAPVIPAHYSRIEQNNWQYLKTIALAVGSFGLYLYYRSCQLQKALQNGKIDDAKNAIRDGGWWLYRHTIGSDDIRSLAFTKEIESIKLIAAQILFDAKVVNGGSNAANALIEARDINVPDYEKLNVLKEILPESSQPRTIVDLDRAAITRDAERIFADKAPKPKPDPCLARYLEHVYTDCKTIEGGTVKTFIDAMHERLRIDLSDPDAAASSKLILTEYYKTYKDLLTDPKKDEKIAELFEFSLERFYFACTADPTCTRETFADAIDERFPSRKADTNPFITRNDLVKYYNKMMRGSYSALAKYDKITSLTS